MATDPPKTVLEAPAVPLWIMVGALGILIGLIVAIFWALFGVILCYVGVMTVIVAGAQHWLRSIDTQPDLDAAGRNQSQNGVLVASVFLGMVITGLVIVCVATISVFIEGTATALFWGLGSLLGGGFLGFLFSLPKETENDKEAPKSPLQVNTSLSQISDWLTKIIVGVSLVNAQTAYNYFVRAVERLGAGLAFHASLEAAQAFAAGLIVTFFFMGLIGIYLLTRLWISAALARADQLAFGAFTTAGVNERDIVILEAESRSLSWRQNQFSAAALDVARRVETLEEDKLRTWREWAAWAKSKSAVGKHEDAIRGYSQAVQLYPESVKLRLDFAVALFLYELALSAQKTSQPT
jgi:hypothetical protein